MTEQSPMEILDETDGIAQTRRFLYITCRLLYRLYRGCRETYNEDGTYAAWASPLVDRFNQPGDGPVATAFAAVRSQPRDANLVHLSYEFVTNLVLFSLFEDAGLGVLMLDSRKNVYPAQAIHRTITSAYEQRRTPVSPPRVKPSAKLRLRAVANAAKTLFAMDNTEYAQRIMTQELPRYLQALNGGTLRPAIRWRSSSVKYVSGEDVGFYQVTANCRNALVVAAAKMAYEIDTRRVDMKQAYATLEKTAIKRLLRQKEDVTETQNQLPLNIDAGTQSPPRELHDAVTSTEEKHQEEISAGLFDVVSLVREANLSMEDLETLCVTCAKRLEAEASVRISALEAFLKGKRELVEKLKAELSAAEAEIKTNEEKLNALKKYIRQDSNKSPGQV